MNRINEQVDVYIDIYKHAHVCVKRYNESSSTKQTSETYVWWHQKRKKTITTTRRAEREKETEILYIYIYLYSDLGRTEQSIG
jgi:hypothetical protein